MSKETKFMIGLVLGFVGFIAYKKLKRTQTTMLDASQNTDPTASIAGLH